jgi:hypothetical protein
MSKVHEETWHVEASELFTRDESGLHHAIADWYVGDDPTTCDRARLAAQAPRYARLLLEFLECEGSLSFEKVRAALRDGGVLDDSGVTK